MPARRGPEGRAGRSRTVPARLFESHPERESRDTGERKPESPTLRDVAELVSTLPGGHVLPPSALRSRPCKGPSILYCLEHRELLDIWTFWDPAAYGDMGRDAISRLEAYLASREPDRGPIGLSRDARVVDLVTAFLDRHAGCRIRACSDRSREYAEVIGSGEEAWTVFCHSEDDTLWERVCLAQVERCRREVERFRRHRSDPRSSWEERVAWTKERELWTRDLRAHEKELRETGRLWPDHVPFGDVLEQLRSAPLGRRLVAEAP